MPKSNLIGLFETLIFQNIQKNFYKSLITGAISLVVLLFTIWFLPANFEFVIASADGTKTTHSGNVVKYSLGVVATVIGLVVYGIAIFNNRVTPFKNVLIWLIQHEIKPKTIKDAVIPLIGTGVENIVNGAKGIETQNGVHVLWEIPKEDSRKEEIRKRVTAICVALVPHGKSTYFATETVSPRKLAPLGHEMVFRDEFTKKLNGRGISDRKRLLILPYCDFMAEVSQGIDGGATDAMMNFINWNIKAGTSLKIMVYFDNSDHDNSPCLDGLLGEKGFWNFALYGDKLVFANRNDVIKIMEGDAGNIYRSASRTLWDNTEPLGRAAVVSNVISNKADLSTFKTQIVDRRKAYDISLSCRQDTDGDKSTICKLADFGTGCTSMALQESAS